MKQRLFIQSLEYIDATTKTSFAHSCLFPLVSLYLHLMLEGNDNPIFFQKTCTREHHLICILQCKIHSSAESMQKVFESIQL